MNVIKFDKELFIKVLKKYLTIETINTIMSEMVANNAILPKDTILTNNDIDIFLSYIASNDMPIAFGNSDWLNVYYQIVGNRKNENIEKWIDSYNNYNDYI